MCNPDWSLRFIALMCLVIMGMDCYILHKTLTRSRAFASTYSPAQYDECIGPQLSVRVVFVSYAILASFIAFLFTMSLVLFDEFSTAFDKAINAVTTFMYICFGPALLTFCIMGLGTISKLQKLCNYNGDLSDRVNTVDPAIIGCATVLSIVVLWCFSLQVTISTASASINDDKSAFFQSFIGQLKSRKNDYAVRK